MLIVDGGECSFGIESTVLKLHVEKGAAEEPATYKLLIIRKGGVSL